jgi:hypothetical protein
MCTFVIHIIYIAGVLPVTTWYLSVFLSRDECITFNYLISDVYSIEKYVLVLMNAELNVTIHLNSQRKIGHMLSTDFHLNYSKYCQCIHQHE